MLAPAHQFAPPATPAGFPDSPLHENIQRLEAKLRIAQEGHLGCFTNAKLTGFTAATMTASAKVREHSPTLSFPLPCYGPLTLRARLPSRSCTGAAMRALPRKRQPSR